MFHYLISIVTAIIATEQAFVWIQGEETMGDFAFIGLQENVVLAQSQAAEMSTF